MSRPSSLCQALLLALLASLGALRAQEAPPDRAAALQKRADDLAKKHKLVEAEKYYLASIEEHKKLVARRPGGSAPALALYRCQNQLARAQAGLWELARAKALLRATISSLEQLGASHPQDRAVRFELARSYRALSACDATADRPVEAVAIQARAIHVLEQLVKEDEPSAEHRKELIEVLISQGSHLMGLARHPESELAFQRAIQLARRFVADAPKASEPAPLLASACNAYALLVRESGRFAQAVALLQETIHIFERQEADHPDRPERWRDLPAVYRNLAQPLKFLNDPAGERAALRAADRLEEKLAKFPASRELVSDEEKVLASLQTLDLERLARQKGELERMLAKAEKDAKQCPEVPGYRWLLARVKVFLALQKLSGGAPETAQPYFREALALLAKLATDFPAIPKYRLAWAQGSNASGMAYLFAGDTAEAEKHLRAAHDGLAKLADAHPRAPKFRTALAEAFITVGMLEASRGKGAEAVKHLKAALAAEKKLADDFPASAEYRRHLAQGHVTLARHLASLGAYAEVEAALREGARLWARTVADFPAHHEFRMYWGDAHTQLGLFLAQHGRAREADEAYLEAIRIHQALVRDVPRDAPGHVALGRDYSYRAARLDDEKRHDDALTCYTRAIACLEAALGLEPGRRDWRFDLQRTFQERGFLYRSLNRTSDYERELQRAGEVAERLEPPLLRLSRANQQLQAGGLAGALKVADELVLDDGLSAGQWYELAELYAKLSAGLEGAEIKERTAGRAVESLGKALERGHKAPAAPAEAPAFRPLAGRGDFKKVVGTQRP